MPHEAIDTEAALALTYRTTQIECPDCHGHMVVTASVRAPSAPQRHGATIPGAR